MNDKTEKTDAHVEDKKVFEVAELEDTDLDEVTGGDNTYCPTNNYCPKTEVPE